MSRALVLPLLLAAAAPPVLAAPQGDGKAPLRPEQLATLARVGAPALSPDGRHLLYTVRTTDLEQNRSTSRVYLLALADGAAPQVVGEGREPCWGRNGQSYAFATAGGIRILPLLDGPVIDLEVQGGVANLSWAPDGNRFAFTQDVKLDATLKDLHPDLPHAEARAYEDLMVRHWDHWRDGTYSHLFTLAADGSRAPIDLLQGQRVDTPLVPFGGAEQLCWAPDGARLCYTAKRVADPENSTDSGLWVAPADGTGDHTLLTPGMPGFDQDPVWSPDGRYLAYSSMERAGFESDRVRLMVHEFETGTQEELLPDFDASCHDVRWTRDGTQLFFTVETEGTTQVFRTEVHEPKAIQVTEGRHALSALQVAPDGKTLYALRTTMERPAEVVRIDVATGAVTALTDHNGEVYAKLQLPSVEAEWFDATDGKRIHSWIVKPPGFDPQTKYPFVLYCQGGPQAMIGQGFSFRWNFHLMAAQGYVVAAVNRRGLPGFGQAWNDEISRDWGGQAMRDLLSVSDAMQARPYVDKARSAAVGASFGGYTVYWLMGHAGDRFACMIAHCGVFNLDSMYLSTEEQWFTNWDLGNPFTDAEAAAQYREFSPHRAIDKWKTPLLVIHGERDFRVPYDQGLQAFTAAQMQGVPSRLLVFPNEGHWVLQPQNGVLWTREFYGWLDRFCGGSQAR
ncbi:MAG: prolyl oligopeptidase family serine peptidase [Planctomycetota bacterium]